MQLFLFSPERVKGCVTVRDSMVFYRSFFEAAEQMSEQEFGAFCNAVFQYAFYGNRENQLTGIGRALFVALIPQIDATALRHQQAVKGGQNRWNGRGRSAEKEKEAPPAKEEAKPEQPEKKSEAPAKQPAVVEKTAPAKAPREPLAVRQYGKFGNVQLTRREYEDLAANIPLLDRVIREYSKYKMGNHLTTLWDYDGLICYHREKRLPPGAFVRQQGQVRGEEEKLYDWGRVAGKPPG